MPYYGNSAKRLKIHMSIDTMLLAHARDLMKRIYSELPKANGKESRAKIIKESLRAALTIMDPQWVHRKPSEESLRILSGFEVENKTYNDSEMLQKVGETFGFREKIEDFMIEKEKEKEKDLINGRLFNRVFNIDQYGFENYSRVVNEGLFTFAEYLSEAEKRSLKEKDPRGEKAQHGPLVWSLIILALDQRFQDLWTPEREKRFFDWFEIRKKENNIIIEISGKQKNPLFKKYSWKKEEEKEEEKRRKSHDSL